MTTEEVQQSRDRLEQDAERLKKYGIKMTDLTCRCYEGIYGNGPFARATGAIGEICYWMDVVPSK
jgi:hypothetical protein